MCNKFSHAVVCQRLSGQSEYLKLLGWIYASNYSQNELYTNHDDMKALKWNSKGFGSANSRS